MYRYGYGVEKTDVKALEYFQIAADKGHATSQYEVGRHYRYGWGVEKDINRAVKFYTLAADNGNTDAIYYLADMYYKGNDIPQDYEKALYYFEKGASLNDGACLNSLAIIYGVGKAVEKNIEKSIDLFHKAVEAGNKYAMYNLGCRYFSGNVIERDIDEAIRLLNMAVEKNYGDAAYKMGTIYMNGENGVEIDINKAYNYFLKAKECGYECDFPLSFTEKSLNITPSTADDMRKYAHEMRNLDVYTVEKVEMDLKADFGDYWNILAPESQVCLITGLTVYLDFFNKYGDNRKIDYSSSITQLCKAMEILSYNLFRTKYVKYLVDNEIPPERHTNVNGMAVKTRDGRAFYPEESSGFTLGSVPRVIIHNYSSDHTETGNKKKSISDDFLDYCQNVLFKGSFKDQKELTEYLRDFVNGVEDIILIRNPSTHDEVMDIIRVEACGDLLLKVKKMIYHLLEKINLTELEKKSYKVKNKKS